MARVAPHVTSLVLLILAAVALVPVDRGLRCRFWLTRPASSVPAPDPTSRTGLIRQEFLSSDFSGPSSIRVDLGVNVRWDGVDAPKDRAYRWTGLIWIPVDGVYSFGTLSDDGSLVCVDDWPVITNWSDHRPLRRFGRVKLTRGFHRIRVDYYQKSGLALCSLLWKPPHQDVEAIPWSYFRTARLPPPFVAAAVRPPTKPDPWRFLEERRRPAPAADSRRSTGRGAGPRSQAGTAASTASAAVQGRVVLPPATDRSLEVRDPVAIPVDLDPWERRPPPPEAVPGWAWSDYLGCFREDSLVAAGTARFAGGESRPLPERPPDIVRVFRSSFTSSWTSAYRFRVTTDAPTVLLVDDKPLIGLPGDPIRSPAEATWTLAMGSHTIRLAVASRSTTRTFSVAPETPPLTIVPVGVPGDPVPRFSLRADQGLIGTEFPRDVPIEDEPLAFRWDGSIDVRSGMSLLAPYVYHWSVARHGHPTVLAPLRATWDGQFLPGRTGPCTLTIRGTGRMLLAVGPHRLFKGQDAHEASMVVSLSDTRIPLSLEVHEPGLVRRVGLYWRFPGERERPVPAACLRPAWADTACAWRRGACAALAVLALLALVGAGGVARYYRFATGHVAFHVWLLILVAGLMLRLHDYSVVPGPGDTDDEFNHHLEGTNLVRGDVPIGWDQHEAFPFVKPVPFYGRVLRIVAPMVFYPPAFTVLVGGLNVAAGATSPFEARMHVTRLLSIALSMLTLALIWPVARAVGVSTSAALLATGFLALYPASVLLGRLLKEENLVAPLYLLLIWVLAGYASSPSFWRRTAAGLLIVTAILTKQMGAATVLLAVVGFVAAGAPGAAVVSVLYGVVGFLLFMWYGLAWGGASFLALQKEHLVYAMRIDALWPLLAEGKITDPVVGSSWVLGLWIAFAFFGLRHWRVGGPGLLTTAGLTYLVVLVLCYPPDRNYGWYRLPLLPILSIAWGFETRRMFRNYDVVRALLWVGLFVLPCLDLTAALGADPVAARPVITESGLPTTEGLSTLPTVTLRLAVVGLVLPALALVLFPGRARRFLSFVLTAALVATIAWGFTLTAWHWGELFPPQWGFDPIRNCELEP